MNKTLNTNKINPDFRSWRVAYARVVGGKHQQRLAETFAKMEHQQWLKFMFEQWFEKRR